MQDIRTLAKTRVDLKKKIVKTGTGAVFTDFNTIDRLNKAKRNMSDTGWLKKCKQNTKDFYF